MSDIHRERPRLTVVGRASSPAGTDPDPHATKPVGTHNPAPSPGDTDTSWANSARSGIDPGQVTCATTTLLTALRIDDLTGTKATQMAHALTQMVTRQHLVIQVTANRADYEELIVSKGIGFRALCEEHMLPLTGVAHIGYIPGDFMMAATEPARVVSYFARQPQSPQQLASQVAHWLERQVHPRGIGVVAHADHTCDADLGMFDPRVTVASTLLGQVREAPLVRTHFMSLTSGR